MSVVNNLPNKVGSIYYDTVKNNYYGYYSQKGWRNIGGVDSKEDTIINNNLNINNDLSVNKNCIISGNLIVNDGLLLPNKKLLDKPGSVYYNIDLNKFYGNYGIKGWKNLGGIDDDEDTKIINNLNVSKKIESHNLEVMGETKMRGVVSMDSTLFSSELILSNKESKLDGGLYIKYNNTLNENQLKLRLNNKDNVIYLDRSPITTLSICTDLFQFYNVIKDREIYGNRVTGLNDPQFNSFTKYYVLQEYIFYEEETNIRSIEYYMSKIKWVWRLLHI